MIISRAPFRISFAGGGSDIPSYYEKYGGSVVSTSINKYIYLDIHPFFDADRLQLKYSQTENVESIEDIKHAIFRRALEKYGVNGAELTCTADLPGGTGMGSSSAFTVALLQSIHTYQGRFRSRTQLADESCDIEINDLKSPIGKQDQYASALGGLNYLTFNMDGSVQVEPITLAREKYLTLDSRLLLFYTGLTRNANDILAEQSRVMAEESAKELVMHRMVNLAGELRYALTAGDIESFGRILDEGWALKRSILGSISSDHIDSIYRLAMGAGAEGGKLLGAGGGGFLLFYCRQEHQDQLKRALSFMKQLPFQMEKSGAQIIFYED